MKYFLYQCNNGHLTCASCHTHTRSCPLCRTPFSNVRPLSAEKLAAQIPTACKNQPHGCDLSLPWADRQRHEAECDLSVGHCPVLSCPVQVTHGHGHQTPILTLSLLRSRSRVLLTISQVFTPGLRTSSTTSLTRRQAPSHPPSPQQPTFTP